MIKVSIIIPAYNAEKYLKQSIESCISQTLKELEIIIIDDGSTDGTGEIAEMHSQNYDHIRYIRTANQGLSMARNEGMKAAGGKYIYFLDADDWIEPECMELCCVELDKNELDFVTFDSVREYENNYSSKIKSEKIRQVFNPGFIYCGSQMMELCCKKDKVFPEAWRNVYRIDFLEKNSLSFISGLYFEDNPFYYSLLQCAKRCKYISRFLHHYRIRSESIMTSQLNIAKVNSIFSISNYLLDEVIRAEENKSLRSRFAANRILSLFSFNLARISAEETETMLRYKERIIKEKEKLIEKVKCIYCREKKTADDLRNACLLTEEIVLSFGCRTEKMTEFLEYLLSENQAHIRLLLQTFPLDQQGRKIGIYGSGRNSDYILEVYRKLIGDIKSDIIYIDTDAESCTKKHNGIDIINIKDIGAAGIQDIIILSFLYEKEMADTIWNLYGSQYRVYRFYNEDSVSAEDTCFGRFYFLDRELRKPEKRLILLCTPEHGNVGDHLITQGEFQFFQKYLPEYKIVEITQNQYDKRRGEIIPEIRRDDVILICGGGFLGSLWEFELNITEHVLKDLKKNKIIILPQSMYYEDNAFGEFRKKRDAEIYREQKDLHICFREKISQKRFNSFNINNVKTYLIPDMALNLDYSGMDNVRTDITLCLRTDKEQTLSGTDCEKLKEYFTEKNELLTVTSMLGEPIEPEFREEAVKEKLSVFKKSKLVITDRLHCMLACAITGTPCIALDNLTGKVEGVYEWIKDLNYIQFAGNSHEIIRQDILNWPETGKNHLFTKRYENEFTELAALIKGGTKE